ncbi:TonB-dependent receptor [Henriciella sp. AS95]|uniref:TonB-dependent receptor n=1 Tax=Henriciella sp. AS95 TaxID=3135782 RepID=UPI00316C85AE
MKFYFNTTAMSVVTLAMLGSDAILGMANAQEQTTAEVEAAQTQEDKLARLGVVTVSARRRDESINDAPVAITALDGDQLGDYAIDDFSDIATQVPTMVVGRGTSGTGASIFLRGVGSTSLSAGFDQSVSINFDGVPMSRGREIILSQYDIERVEVLKGPQALFFGKNTTGGLINVVTKGPTDIFEAGGRVGYGFEADKIYGEGFVSGPLTDTLSARLAVRAVDSEGAFENNASLVSTDPLGRTIRRTSEKRGGEEDLSGRFTLDWTPSEFANLELKVGASSHEDRGASELVERVCAAGRTTPATANGVPPSPNSGCTIDGVSDYVTIPQEVTINYPFARDGEPYADFNSEYGILTGSFSFDTFDIDTITGYYQFEQQDLNNVGGESYPATFTQRADFSQASQEIRFTTKWDGPFNLMFGGFYSDEDFLFYSSAYIFPVPVDPVQNTARTFVRNSEFEATTTSLFAEARYDLTDTLELSGGARWSRVERDSLQFSAAPHSNFAGAFPDGVRLEDEFSDENVSPQVTLRWKPSVNTTWYVSYKEGFKSGGYNLSQSLTPAASVAAGEYDSETAQGFEVGLRTIAFDQQLRFNATAYDFEYDNLQVQKFDPVTIGQISDNAGSLTTKGVEVDFDFAPNAVEGLSIRGALAYNDASYSDYVGQCFGGQTIAEGCTLLPNNGAFTSRDYDGLTPPKSPEWSGRFGGSYQFPIGSLTAQLSSDLTYTSEYNYTDTLRPDSIQDAFTKIDAAFSITGPTDQWTVSLIGRNLTDELVASSANDIPFTGGAGTGTTSGTRSDMSAQVANPREVYLELSYRF